MLLLQKRITVTLATCLLASGVLNIPATALTSSNPALGTDVAATVTAHHGVVFKRSFTDFVKQTYGDPLPVSDMDKLREGMQIGTGNESWAEVQWPSVRTRAWANTVFSVAPNKRLVYLAGGEMLFRLDKHRADKDQPYYIWTKVLQARIRGTTVLVQAKANTTRFTVMEGVVDIWNRLDKSHVTLTPGVVYEVKGFDLSKQVPLPDVKSTKSTAEPTATAGSTGEVAPYKAQPLTMPALEDKSVQDVTYDAKNFIPVFQDKYEQTNVYVSNSQALENHPLVTGLNGAIDSTDLIHQAQHDLPGFNPVIPIKFPGVDQARQGRIVSRNVQVKGVPTNADWYVGKSFSGKISQMAFVDLQPKGVVFNPTQVVPAAANTALPSVPSVSRVAVFTPMPIPMLPPYTGKTVDLDDAVPAPVQEFAQPSAGLPGGQTGILGGAISNSSNGMSPSMTGISPISSVSGGSAAANMTNVTAPVTSVSVSGTVVAPAALTSGLGASSTSGQLSNTINNTLNSLGGVKLP